MCMDTGRRPVFALFGKAKLARWKDLRGRRAVPLDGDGRLSGDKKRENNNAYGSTICIRS